MVSPYNDDQLVSGLLILINIVYAEEGYFQIEDFLTSNLTFDLDFLLAIGLVHLPFLFLKCFARSEDRPNFLFSSIGYKMIKH